MWFFALIKFGDEKAPVAAMVHTAGTRITMRLYFDLAQDEKKYTKNGWNRIVMFWKSNQMSVCVWFFEWRVYFKQLG